MAVPLAPVFVRKSVIVSLGTTDRHVPAAANVSRDKGGDFLIAAEAGPYVAEVRVHLNPVLGALVAGRAGELQRLYT